MKCSDDKIVLGISCFFHDSSASLIINGKIVAAAQEERFSRKKHDNSFPKQAIEWCLASQNLKMADVDYVAFYEKPITKFERALSQFVENFPKTMSAFGILVSDNIGEIIANHYIDYYNPSIPTKIFFSEEQTIEWLRQFVEERVNVL